MQAPHGTVLFVTDANYVRADAAGGVQLCTQEYIALLAACGLTVEVHTVSPDRALKRRIASRLHLEIYWRYDVRLIAAGIITRAQELGARVVALNQVDLVRLAPVLRAALGPNVRLVVLSHGNESGDFLHEVVRRPAGSVLARVRDAVRLGFVIREEARLLSGAVDLVLCLSDVERRIDQWLGAREVLVIPRTFRPRPIPWNPVPGRVGFVGTLDHLPNSEGIRRVLDTIATRPGPTLTVRLVGRPEKEGRRLAEQYPFVEYLGALDQPSLQREVGTWSLFLNPVWWYARGASTKLAEGIAWGIPVLTTTAGYRGYEWNRGELLVADDPAAFVAIACFYALDQKRLAAAASHVREVAASGPTLESIAAALVPRLLQGPMPDDHACTVVAQGCTDYSSPVRVTSIT